MIIQYDRVSAVAYAKRWALLRNPLYLDFHSIGGDCTNFVSQCLYAGCGVMNTTPVYGWYYYSADNRSPSWTSVIYLYRFLLSNQGNGPFARETTAHEMRIGDVVQLGYEGKPFSHAVLVVALRKDGIYVASHSEDAWMKPLSLYRQPLRRFLHIEGVRIL